ncbi:hypothetical protein BraRD5C2_68940 [Bradyrhizobium sp. RD5-C2]|nr:hypothetical protein BraRD5C2_68940 [Bradyrhizobium sp. RD5-C2]
MSLSGCLSGCPRYNYGKDNFKIPPAAIEKREKLRAVAARHCVDLRTAVLQFDETADESPAMADCSDSPLAFGKRGRTAINVC